jgi:F-type H+-transporting ATPase subunit delta
VSGVTRTALLPKISNLLQACIENGRLVALPEVARAVPGAGQQPARCLRREHRVSAFPLDPAQLADTVAVLEKRFGRKLKAEVEVVPELIGGIRVVVGDEVLDTSVRARLEQMKVALTH